MPIHVSDTENVDLSGRYPYPARWRDQLNKCGANLSAKLPEFSGKSVFELWAMRDHLLAEQRRELAQIQPQLQLDEPPHDEPGV